MSKQPTALRLADALNCATDDDCGYCQPCVIAAELRRLHAVNAELLEALKAMLAVWEEDPAYGATHADKARAAVIRARGNP